MDSVFSPCEIMDKLKIIWEKDNHSEIMGEYISLKTFSPFCPLRQMERIQWYKGSNYHFCAFRSTEWAPSQCLLVHRFSQGLFILLCTCSNNVYIANKQNFEIKITLSVLDIVCWFYPVTVLKVFSFRHMTSAVVCWGGCRSTAACFQKIVIKPKYFYFLFYAFRLVFRL